MKKWQLAEVKKYFTQIVSGAEKEVQAIIKDDGETIYLIPGIKKRKNK